jgi:hypothetical protein
MGWVFFGFLVFFLLLVVLERLGIMHVSKSRKGAEHFSDEGSKYDFMQGGWEQDNDRRDR